MVNLRNVIDTFKTDYIQVGHKKAISNLGYKAANKFISVRRFEIVVLKREDLVPIDKEKYHNVFSRLATERDLDQMEVEGKWQISPELRDSFRNGDRCLLSFIANEMAGYTWIHTAGHPQLIPGLRISIPENFGYNYAGFTLPKFRGHGLQPYRHHEILNYPDWRDKKGMFGYVELTNWSSKKGQSKSGYKKLGDMTLIGSGSSLQVIISSKLKKLGIKRIDHNEYNSA